MPEESKPLKPDLAGPARVAAISLAGIAIAFGLCGAGSWDKGSGVAAVFGVILFLISVPSLFVSLIWLLIASGRRP